MGGSGHHHLRRQLPLERLPHTFGGPHPLCKQAAPSAHAAPVTHCVCARPLPLGHGGLADLGGQ